MKRDMDLVRYLLMTIEEADGPLHLNDFSCTEWSTEEIKYHLALLLNDPAVWQGRSTYSSTCFLAPTIRSW